MNIVEKRADGFHNIETVFYPIGWCDALEAVENKGYKKGEDKIQLSLSGLSVEGNSQDNLIVKAYHHLDMAYNLPPVRAHLHKVIPMGAGLGGGSADAAFFINLMNDKFSLNISVEERKRYASLLGSDCAFFIENKPVYASGKGDIFSSVSLDLSKYYFVVIYPNIHSNTALAYKNIVPVKPKLSLQEIIQKDIHGWRDLLKNDFEKDLFERYPELQQIKNILYKKGAIYAAMSGSGSALFGIFKEEMDAEIFDFPRNYIVWCHANS